MLRYGQVPTPLPAAKPPTAGKLSPAQAKTRAQRIWTKETPVHCSATDKFLRHYRWPSHRWLGNSVPLKQKHGPNVFGQKRRPCIAPLRTSSYAITDGKATDGWETQSRSQKHGPLLAVALFLPSACKGGKYPNKGQS